MPLKKLKLSFSWYKKDISSFQNERFFNKAYFILIKIKDLRKILQFLNQITVLWNFPPIFFCVVIKIELNPSKSTHPHSLPLQTQRLCYMARVIHIVFVVKFHLPLLYWNDETNIQSEFEGFAWVDYKYGVLEFVNSVSFLKYNYQDDRQRQGWKRTWKGRCQEAQEGVER